ncbi:MAG: 16S rRNA processing protein RimM [Desulforhopalus sp.]|nr:16S rRNA processing protein RimM [Desulforhopalus sp.]
MADDYSYPTDKYVLLGKVAKAHGLRGEVKIFSFSGQPENFCGYKEVILVNTTGNLSSAFAIEKFRVQGRTVIVKLDRVDSRGQAEEIEGMGVLLAKDLLPDTAEDEFYWYQYEGKLVFDQSGRSIGRVESLFNNGAQDIIVVKSGTEEILIPVTKSIIVKETAEELIVNPPPGLLDLKNEAGD